MGIFVANKVLKLMIKKSHIINKSKVLVLGITFKENCPDVRNSKVIDVINELKEFGCEVDVYDPIADKEEVKKEYNINLLKDINLKKYDTIILAVAHNEFKNIEQKIKKAKENNNSLVVYDIKGMFDKTLVDGRL